MPGEQIEPADTQSIAQKGETDMAMTNRLQLVTDFDQKNIELSLVFAHGEQLEPRSSLTNMRWYFEHLEPRTVTERITLHYSTQTRGFHCICLADTLQAQCSSLVGLGATRGDWAASGLWAAESVWRTRMAWRRPFVGAVGRGTVLTVLGGAFVIEAAGARHWQVRRPT